MGVYYRLRERVSRKALDELEEKIKIIEYVENLLWRVRESLMFEMNLEEKRNEETSTVRMVYHHELEEKIEELVKMLKNMWEIEEDT